MSRFSRPGAPRVTVEVPRATPRGELQPGVVSDSQISSGESSTEHIRFHRQGFAYDDTLYGSLSVPDNTTWKKFGGAGHLMLKIGSGVDPFVAWIDAYGAWANNAPSTDFTGKIVLALYAGTDPDEDGVVSTFTVYQRSVNGVRNALPADGRSRGFSLSTQLVIPAVDGVEWWVGLQCHMTGGAGAVANQDHREQMIRCWTSRFDPELDSNLLTDAGLGVAVAINEFRTPAPPAGAGRLTVRRDRRGGGIQWKLHQPQTVWTFPWIQATGPEKLVFMELVRRHIFFKFQALLIELVPEARGVPVLDLHPYRADFAIPSLKIILDPWDDYHHALNAKDDAVKLAIYKALGWTTYHVWASELAQNGVSWWFDTIPGLQATKRGGFKLYHTQEDSAGIAAQNRGRRSFKSPTLKRRVNRGRRLS